MAETETQQPDKGADKGADKDAAKGAAKPKPKRPGIMGEFIQFLLHEKKWWLIPLIVVLLGLVGLMVLLESSSLAPFIYPLF